MSHTETELQLRRYLPQAAPSIVTWPQTIDEARWWVGPQTTWPVPRAAVQRWHADPDVHPYILSLGTTLLGYGELWVDPDEQEVELARLIVAPEHRGQGFGRALVLLLLEEARRTEYSRVFLRVVPENHAAIACYRRAGFTPVSQEDQQAFNQGQPVDYFWMYQALS